MSISSSARPLAFAVALLAVACARPGSDPHRWPVAHDLAAELPLAEVRREADPPPPPRPPAPPDPQLAAPVQGGLALRAGARLESAIGIEGEAAIAWERVAAREGATAIEILAAVEGQPEARLATIAAGSGRGSSRLPGRGLRIVRFAFRATGDAGWAVLSQPTIRARRASTPSPEPRLPTPPPAATAGARSTPTVPAAASPRPSVVLYLIDTLRADRLGVYGGRRGLTPSIDTFAREAIVFEHTTAASSWTRPSTATLLTGLPPLAHGATRLDRRLPPGVTTLAERLRAAGYRTAAWSANAHVLRETGFAQGFESFTYLGDLPRADRLGALALDWIDSLPREAPFFAYLHTIDPHAPYDPPADLRRRFAPGVAADAGSREAIERVYKALAKRRRDGLADLPPLYDAEVAAVDRSFGALIDALERRGRRADTLIVLVSDHGEEFGEHGALGHGHALRGELLDVPLLVALPGRSPARPAGGRSPAPAGHVDLVPTILAALGLSGDGLPGRDLLAAAQPTADRPLFSHLDYEGRLGASVRAGRFRLEEPWSRRFARWPRLYDVEADPGEARDLWAANPVRATFLRRLLRAETFGTDRRQAATGSSPLSPEERRALEALGYL